MNIGVTGTRSGCTKEQLNTLKKILKIYVSNNTQKTNFHHGNCVGVDTESAEIAKEIGYHIICHPPIKTDLIGSFNSDEYREPKSYFNRNRQIVDECELLIVVPYQSERQTSGGTWYTYDYAIKKNKKIILITPDGKTSVKGNQ